MFGLPSGKAVCTIACVTISAAISGFNFAAEGENSWEGGAELGFVSTAGNSKTKTVNAKLDVKKSWSAWADNYKIDALNSKQDGIRSAEKYSTYNKLQYNFNQNDYTFWDVDYEKDRFSGFENQTGTSIGYGRKLIHNDIHNWDIEIGPGYRASKLENGDKQEEAVVKLTTHYEWKISDSAKFNQLVSHEEGDDNSISRSESSLSTQIAGQLAMKVSYKVKYVDVVPLGFERTDTETAVTLVYAIK